MADVAKVRARRNAALVETLSRFFKNGRTVQRYPGIGSQAGTLFRRFTTAVSSWSDDRRALRNINQERVASLKQDRDRTIAALPQKIEAAFTADLETRCHRNNLSQAERYDQIVAVRDKAEILRQMVCRERAIVERMHEAALRRHKESIDFQMAATRTTLRREVVGVAVGTGQAMLNSFRNAVEPVVLPVVSSLVGTARSMAVTITTANRHVRALKRNGLAEKHRIVQFDLWVAAGPRPA